MLWTIIGAIIVGLLIGACARLIMPGHQNLSLLMTILIGIAGSLIGSWVAYAGFGYSNNNGGFEWIPFLIGVVVAMGLIMLYGKLTGGRSRV